jgi:putative transcriptional regulator
MKKNVKKAQTMVKKEQSIVIIRLIVNSIYLRQMAKRQVYNRLRIVLAETNKSNRDIANYLDMSESTVSKWVNNRKQPSLEIIFKIAKFLKVSPTELIEKEEKYIEDK